jgi:TRAP-type uncharacterized transport system fused permease subunit
VRLGLIGFIIPFFFLDNPVLLIGVDTTASLATTLWAVFTASLGTVALVSALEGWLIHKDNILERVILLAAAPAMMYPGILTDIAGIICLGGVTIYQFICHRRAQNPTLPA